MNINFEDHEVEALRDWIEEVDNLVREDTTLAPRIKRVYEILDEKTAPKTIEVTGFDYYSDALRTARNTETNELVTVIGYQPVKETGGTVAIVQCSDMWNRKMSVANLSFTPEFRRAMPFTDSCEEHPSANVENLNKHYLVAVLEEEGVSPKAICKVQLDMFYGEMIYNIEEVYNSHETLIEPGDSASPDSVFVLGEVVRNG